jgi:hypothetical protein
MGFVEQIVTDLNETDFKDLFPNEEATEGRSLPRVGEAGRTDGFRLAMGTGLLACSCDGGPLFGRPRFELACASRFRMLPKEGAS